LYNAESRTRRIADDAAAFRAPRGHVRPDAPRYLIASTITSISIDTIGINSATTANHLLRPDRRR